MSVNIGSQTGGVVNHVAGDRYVSARVGRGGAPVRRAGGSPGPAVGPGGGRPSRFLGPGQRAELTADADAIIAEVSEPAPPPTSIRARITGVLREAGALAGAAGAFVGPVTALAQWLGPLGASVLAMPACRSTSQPCSWTRRDPASAPRRRPRGP